jgi:hypothetical protein
LTRGLGKTMDSSLSLSSAGNLHFLCRLFIGRRLGVGLSVPIYDTIGETKRNFVGVV